MFNHDLFLPNLSSFISTINIDMFRISSVSRGCPRNCPIFGINLTTRRHILGHPVDCRMWPVSKSQQWPVSCVLSGPADVNHAAKNTCFTVCSIGLWHEKSFDWLNTLHFNQIQCISLLLRQGYCSKQVLTISVNDNVKYNAEFKSK